VRERKIPLTKKGRGMKRFCQLHLYEGWARAEKTSSAFVLTKKRGEGKGKNSFFSLPHYKGGKR